MELDDLFNIFTMKLGQVPVKKQIWLRQDVLEDLLAKIEKYTQDLVSSDTDEERSNSYSWRALAKRDLGLLENALADINQALSLKETSLAQDIHGIILTDQKEYIGATKAFDTAIKLDPNSPYPHQNKARAMLDISLDSAMEEVEKALSIKPDLPHAYDIRGLIKFKKEKYKDAIADFNEAIKLKPQLAEAYLNRANAWFELYKKKEVESLDSALEDIETAIQLKPGLAAAYHVKGRIEIEQKKHQDSISNSDNYLKKQKEIYAEKKPNNINKKTPGSSHFLKKHPYMAAAVAAGLLGFGGIAALSTNLYEKITNPNKICHYDEKDIQKINDTWLFGNTLYVENCDTFIDYQNKFSFFYLIVADIKNDSEHSPPLESDVIRRFIMEVDEVPADAQKVSFKDKKISISRNRSREMGYWPQLEMGGGRENLLVVRLKYKVLEIK